MRGTRLLRRTLEHHRAGARQGYGLPGFRLSLRFLAIEPVESNPVSPAFALAFAPADGVAAGWVARVVPSGALPKRCVFRGSVSVGLNSDGAELCANASLVNAAASAPSATATALERSRSRGDPRLHNASRQRSRAPVRQGRASAGTGRPGAAVVNEG